MVKLHHSEYLLVYKWKTGLCAHRSFYMAVDNPSNVMPDQEIIIEGDAGFVPKASPSDAGKVLGVLNSSGDVGWVVDQSGTFIQVQADWAESDSSQPSYIDRKPDLSIYAESSDLATVATTGSYDDLLNKPAIPAAQVNSDWNSNSGVSQILNKPSLSTVATTGDYSDLLNKPSIPAAQVNSDWNAVSGVAQILNKPDLSAYATDSELADGLATKQNVINDLDTIRSGAAAGATAAQPSDLPSSDELVPSASSGDSGKVLTVDNHGNPGWVTPSAGTVYTPGDGIDITSDVISADVDGTTIGIDSTTKKIKSLQVIPTKTSDLQNDSNFVVASSLATVATSGSYADLSNKPSIPAAQVNADWNSSSGVSEILNKPNLATVATTGAYSDLSGKPTIPSVDQTYSASSSNAQSGTAVAGAIAGVKQVPASTSSDANKVLTVDSNGTAGWQTPASVTVDQTYNASSTNAQSGTAVAQAIAAIPSVDEVPDVTSSDDGKVLTAAYSGGSGSYSWQPASGGGSSYTAGDGIDITAGEISVRHDNTLSVARTYGAASTLEPFSDTTYVFETNSDFKGWVKNGSAGEYLRVSIPANAFTYDTGYTAYLGISDGSNTAFYPIQLSATALSNGYLVDAQTVDLPLPVGSSTGWEGSVNLSSSNLWLVIAEVQSGNVSGFAHYYYTRQSMQVAKSNPGGAIAVSNPLPSSTSADANKILKVNASGNAEWGTDGFTTTAGITDIQQVAALPANPVATVLYLIPEA